jgi:MFS family permease
MTISGSDLRSSATAHIDDASPAEMAVGVIIGRTSESFDFLIYAIASVIVFPKTVFPFVDALTGALYSFAIFSLAFLARPLGTVLFTQVDRRLGRGTKLGAALMLLGTSTVAIAFLPGYAEIGVASVWLLALCRFAQGLALAGSWDGLPSLLAVHAPPHRRGFYAMIPQLGAPLGAMVASAVFAYIIANLSTADFLDWGWRYPFFVAFAINVVALFARLRIVVTPEYVKLFASRELQPSGILETVRGNARTIAIGAFVPLASFALFHIVTVFPLSWILLLTPERASRFLVIQATGAVLGRGGEHRVGMAGRSPGAQEVAREHRGGDCRVQRVRATAANAGPSDRRCSCWRVPFCWACRWPGIRAVATNFPMRHRYTGSALTSDLAWLFGAGFAPWVALCAVQPLRSRLWRRLRVVRRRVHFARAFHRSATRRRPLECCHSPGCALSLCCLSAWRWLVATRRC